MGMLRPDTVRRLRDAATDLADEVGARAGRVAKGPVIADVLTGSFPQQREFVLDIASPFLFAFCTRRAAKTYSVGLKFINDAQTHPRAKYVFLSLTREAARSQFWDDVLKDIHRRYPELGMTFNETRLEARLPNGARIVLIGADTSEKEQKKLLGGKNRMICIDEAQDWRMDLEKMIIGTLSPSVADLHGQIMLTGTPGNLVNGYFHKVTKNCKAGRLSSPEQREPGWKGYTWTTHENTSIVDGEPMNETWAKKITAMVTANPRIAMTPFFRQNYLGEWVVDMEARVYRYDPERNSFDGKLPVFPAPYGYTGPAPRWHFVLGIDLGYYPDPTTLVLCAYHDWDTHLYLVHSWKEWKMDFTAVSERVRWYDDWTMLEHGESIEAHVIDGANKQGVEEMRKRHGLDLISAEKQGKEHYIELMNTDFLIGAILVGPGCSNGKRRPDGDESLLLSDEYAGLIWDPDTKPGSRKEHDSCPNHLADAALYAWRRCYQFLSSKPKPKPQHGTPEWVRAQEAKMREEAEVAMESRQQEAVGLGDSSNWEDWTKW